MRRLEEARNKMRSAQQSRIDALSRLKKFEGMPKKQHEEVNLFLILLVINLVGKKYSCKKFKTNNPNESKKEIQVILKSKTSYSIKSMFMDCLHHHSMYQVQVSMNLEIITSF